MGMIGDLIGAVAQVVPGWLLALLVIIGFLLAAPGWLVGLKVKRVKALLRRVTRATGEARQELLDQAWEAAEGRGEVMIALAKEADKMNLPALRDRAIGALQQAGTHQEAIRLMLAPKNPMDEKRRFGHPVEARVSIERLIENGATEAARERLREARERFPRDPDLLALEDLDVWI